MATSPAPGFYGNYATFKRYTTPEIGRKHIRRFDSLVWKPAACTAAMRFLEIGCGTGPFLAYLAAKGCTDFVGIDHDPALAEVVPAAVRDRFVCGDLRDLLADPAVAAFDRIVALDVLEHFTAEEGRALLERAAEKLRPGGRIVLRVPNAASPWGLTYQQGDLTHRTAFSPGALRQLADAAGLTATAILPQAEGRRRRVFTDRLVHGFLSWALLNPPEIWSANIVAILEPRR